MRQAVDDNEDRLYEMFAVLRQSVVQIATDLAARVKTGIVAEDDGRFGPPSLIDLLDDLTNQASGALTAAIRGNDASDNDNE